MDHQQSSRKQTPNSPEVAIANNVFDQFCNATTLKSILGQFRHLCEVLKIKPNTITQFYPKLKAKLRSWKAQALWKKFDQRANHKCYNRGKACPNTRVLIIGGGPCGLRSAIEAQLLGAKVVVVEKRDRMSRNNVLHLWPFVIQDLRGLGAKKFFGKFCAGSIDHISIRQLQCILLKVALILGVEFHESVSFDSLIPPPENQEEGKIGWRAKTTPADHPVSQYEFDVLIGADGKRNTLEGFKRKEFRGKLAIAITANFINKRTEAEARVEEISGVAFIFNQKFFKELYQETGIDLENIVYYKDDTHYFVMTAKKHSLIDKGVILQDHADTAKLLAKENVDREALMLYAREAAEFSTEYQMMDMEFAVNHYGQPDVAMFDFTSMYAAENASRVLERRGHRLLMILVGDSLLEPFWPTGSGCARGFLSSLDACWAIKGWGASVSPLEVIAERESIYRLLGQTTPENLNRDYAAYTLDPHTRYPNLNVSSVTAIQVRSLLDTDDPESIKHPPIQSEIDIPKKRRRRDLRGDAQVHPDVLLRWLQRQVALYDTVQIEDMGASFKNGLAICAIIHRYRPDLIDFHSLQPDDVIKNNQLAFDILEKELGISPVMTGEEMAQCDVPDKLAMFSYLTQIYEVFRGEIPHIRHPKLEPENEERPAHNKQLSQLTPDQKAHLIDRIARQDSATRTRHSRSRHNENVHPLDKKGDTISRRSRKRRSTEKMGATVEERQQRLAEIEKNRVERMRRRQYLRYKATQQFYKSMQMLQANAKREKEEPFEDYSIFLYRQTAPDFKDRVKYLEQKILYPDREPKMHAGHRKGSVDEEFSERIKYIEDKLRGSTPSEKKPRDLLRAIGKIEKTDWNVKEIEKKIEENKMGRSVRHDKVERVPKWSREQFLARQIKMEKKGRDQKESDSKYADIDNTLKNIDRKIKEGNVLGHNKVSAMAEQFSNKNQDAEPKVQKSNTKPAVMLPAQGGSEMCHFCNKRVYLMERLSAEGKFFHRGCFRCEYCSTSLRIGNHTFDREKNGGRFYCTQHFGFSGTMKARAEKKRITALNKENIPNASVNIKTPEKIPLEGLVGLDLLDRGQTPERIEFENLAGISDAEEAQSQMDEDEWTDRNFGASTAEMGSSDDISDMSDSDDDNEVYEEAIDQPLTTEGTLELAKNWTLRYSHPHAATGQSDTGSNEYEDSSDEYTSEDDESGTATEDEEDIRARELRKQEVWVKHAARNSDTDTGSDTEVNILQDSVHNVTEESVVLPESASAQNSSPTLSPVSNVDSDDVVVDQNINDVKDVPNSLETKSLRSDVLMENVGEEVGNHVNPDDEKDASQDNAYGSIIPKSNSTFDLISHSISNNITNLNTALVPADYFSIENFINVCLNSNINKENCNSKYGSLVEQTIISDSDRIDDITVESRNEDNLDNSTLKSIDASDIINNELSNKVMSSLIVDTSEAENDLSNKSSIDNVGIILPDAIPCNETSCDSMLPHTKGIMSSDEKLPDLIASPKHSRQSSFSSLPEMYLSTESLYNESSIINDELEDTRVPELERLRYSDEDPLNVKQNKLNIAIKKLAEIPTVTVTSPSPTIEKPQEEISVEIAKLTIPKEVVNKSISCDPNSSFDKLKRDLRQRKAKNRLSVGELRPLSKENAQMKISKYFVGNKKSETKSQRSVTADKVEKVDDVKVVKLDIKPKLSNKVETKDIMKYFNKAKTSTDQVKIDNSSTESLEINDLNASIDELSGTDESDIDIINQQFDQIEVQDQFADLTGEDDTQLKSDLNTLAANNPVENTNVVETMKNTVTIEERHKCPETPNSDISLPSKSFVNEEETNLLNNVPKSKVHVDQTNKTAVLSENTEKIEGKRAVIPSRLNEIKKANAEKSNALHASDSTLNILKKSSNESNVLCKNSKSSSELTSPSTENVPIENVKVVEQVLAKPMIVDKVSVNNNNVVLNALNEVPKRPERKYGYQDSSSSPRKSSLGAQQVPEVPARRRSGKRKSTSASSSKESSSQMQTSTPAVRLAVSETGVDKHQQNNLKISSTSAASQEIEKDSTSLGNTASKQKYSHSENHPVSNKLEHHKSTKSLSSKSDRAKKDKCVVS